MKKRLTLAYAGILACTAAGNVLLPGVFLLASCGLTAWGCRVVRRGAMKGRR